MPPAASACADLADPQRLHALAELGLTDDSDARMEDFATWVREELDVSVALVSLVRPDAQVFPGMAGLPEPWASKRSTPLSHSFCQYVVISAAPLAVTDARDHPLVRDNLAVPDLGVIAYAGMPLTDLAGNVLGSLCAIDTRPRAWTERELATLERIARACTTDLRLRLARHDAGEEEARRDRVEAAQRDSIERSTTLLLAAQAFTHTNSVDDVLARIRGLVGSRLAPDYVGAVILDDNGHTRRLHDDPVRLSPTHSHDLDPLLPSALAIRDGAIIHHPDLASFDAHHPAAASAIMRHLGLESVVAVPLPGPDGPLGSIVLGWRVPHLVGADDLLAIATIGGYASQALARARVLDHRLTVAHELQAAMLTTLPDVAGLSMAARYAPADSREHVGGDWYDAAPLDGASDGSVVLASVGDIVGHTIDAAAIMGQARSMLRQAAWEHPDDAPSVVLTSFERASAGLALKAQGTAVLARLCRSPTGRWTVSWTNAGHPPPVLIAPDGSTELLVEHDMLFGFGFPECRIRTDASREIAPGSTLILYTDGLVERKCSDIDTGIEALLAILRRTRDRPVVHIVDAAFSELGVDSDDDVVVFAIRFSPP
ncbi:MAG: hypothetical protein ABS81_10725 [Pseudonocardia sp. SCN 72-86]|nr:MAG: hypothetical protein ABS81_10725 [Pseudonocardia sp. SCN 72-86]